MDLTLHQDEIGGLLPEWAELFALDERATPFQSPAWADAWWRHWADRSRPWVLVARDAGRLVGLAPLRSRRLFGLRMLEVTGDPTDYWDVLARPGYRTQVEEAVGEEVQRREGEWDVVVVGRLPPASSTAAGFERAGLRAVHRSEMPCPGMPLPETFDDYLRTLRTQSRTNLRRHLRRLDEGELECRTPSIEELPEALDRWQALRIRQWAAMGKRLAREHTQQRFREFLVEVTTELVPAGLAVVWEFIHAGEVVGSFVNFCDERAFYQYLGGFAPELRTLGIGKIAIGASIRSSIAAGRSYYDFARGSEPYKYWYGATDRESPTVVLTGSRMRSLLAGRLGALLPAARG